MGVPILGTKAEDVDAAEDRELFDAILEQCEIPRPAGQTVFTTEEAIKAANELGYPVLVRPSYVLGGQGMQIATSDKEIAEFMEIINRIAQDHPILVDKYLVGKEIEVDAVCDGEDILIPGIMEHIERAGVHSGDSVSIYPPQNISDKIIEKIKDVTYKIAVELNVIGMINIQFIEYRDELYIIEVNPRSSRTVPYITKVTNVPVIEIATRIMLGETLKDMGYTTGIAPETSTVAIKVPVFSTEKLPQVEVSLGPEMRSTGEVLGVGKSFSEAMYKGFVGAGTTIPEKGSRILASIKDLDKENFLPIAKKLDKIGCKFIATSGTAAFLEKNGIEVEVCKKIAEGVPNIVDIIRSGMVDFVVDIPSKSNDVHHDGFKIRRAAIECSISIMTSLDTLSALVQVMEEKYTVDKTEIVAVDDIV